MAIGYYKLKRKLNVNGTVKDVYVAKVARANVVDTDILAEEIAAMCTASEGDVLMVLRNMEHVIKNHLSKGDVVKLSSLGTFSPTIRAKAVDKADDVNQFSIESTGINFKPTQRLLNGVREAGVWLADKRIMKAIVRKKAGNE
ncbi:MAG: HU family DNA-binding protein [Bacteroidales bacterium]|jgi:predicted histone-like DNA-binding protein|nr:HU family DNA-binding protein [Bacteroidales bacterium]